MTSFEDSLQQINESADPASAYVGLLVSLQLAGFVPSDAELIRLHEVAREHKMTHELLQVKWQNDQLESCRLC